MGVADLAPTTDTNVGMAWVEGVSFAVVNGSFDAVVRLVRGRNRITVEAVDPAGNAREEEVEVRHGAAWPEVGLVVAVVAGVVAARWAMLGRKKVKREGQRGKDRWLRRIGIVEKWVDSTCEGRDSATFHPM